jgi:uncharacterized protein (DUF1015 family)
VLVRKSKRAEQNRKAQQAFRKRREEKIKELESKAKEMERLYKAIDDGHRRVSEVEIVSRRLREFKGFSLADRYALLLPSRS